jgi:hypothetical protein
MRMPACCRTRAGFPLEVQEPMTKPTPIEQEGIDLEYLREEASLHGYGIGETQPECRVCGTPITEGERIVLHVFRKATQAAWQFGYAKCADHHDESVGEYTCGFRELIVDGRVGICSDHNRQSAWPILLHPNLRKVSPAATTDSERVRPAPWLGELPATSEPCDLITERFVAKPAGITNDSSITAKNLDTEGGDLDGR